MTDCSHDRVPATKAVRAIRTVACRASAPLLGDRGRARPGAGAAARVAGDAGRLAGDASCDRCWTWKTGAGCRGTSGCRNRTSLRRDPAITRGSRALVRCRASHSRRNDAPGRPITRGSASRTFGVNEPPIRRRGRRVVCRRGQPHRPGRHGAVSSAAPTTAPASRFGPASPLRGGTSRPARVLGIEPALLDATLDCARATGCDRVTHWSRRVCCEPP